MDLNDVITGGHDGGWAVVLLMSEMFTDAPERRREFILAVEAERAFDAWADGCAHLQLENDGRATERICRHPARDNLSDWVICNMAECPLRNSQE